MPAVAAEQGCPRSPRVHSRANKDTAAGAVSAGGPAFLAHCAQPSAAAEVDRGGRERGRRHGGERENLQAHWGKWSESSPPHFVLSSAVLGSASSVTLSSAIAALPTSSSPRSEE